MVWHTLWGMTTENSTDRALESNRFAAEYNAAKTDDERAAISARYDHQRAVQRVLTRKYYR